jgi:hypothetical protein
LSGVMRLRASAMLSSWSQARCARPVVELRGLWTRAAREINRAREAEPAYCCMAL